jgi:hypothetical protein
MKTLKLTAIICLLLAAIVSCNKGSNSKTDTTSTGEAADLVTASLSVTTNGALSNFTDVTVSAQAKLDIDSLCGETWTDSVNRSVPFGLNQGYTYNYKAKHTYTYVCGTSSNVLAGTVNTTSNYSGDIGTPSLISTFTGSSAFSVGGVGRESAEYTLNGDYKRSGMFQFRADTSFEGMHSIDITVTNLILIKPLRTIKSGSASFTISGVMPKRGSFTYNGTIVFNGGNNATLTVNGTVYLINLSTGEKKRG